MSTMLLRKLAPVACPLGTGVGVPDSMASSETDSGEKPYSLDRNVALELSKGPISAVLVDFGVLCSFARSCSSRMAAAGFLGVRKARGIGNGGAIRFGDPGALSGDSARESDRCDCLCERREGGPGDGEPALYCTSVVVLDAASTAHK